MPVYLSDDEKEKKKKPKKKKEDVFLPYWLDVEKQRQVKLYNDTTAMTGGEIIRRVLWVGGCILGAIAVGGRSCGL
jgi:hypothetical protein